MAAGTLLYAIGFGMYGFVSAYLLFMLAMVIITIGEMLVAPVGQAIVATLAPEDMRGRYMAVYGFSWVIPTAIGPLLAGLIMDNISPFWVWYAAGIVGLIAAAGFYMLERRVDASNMTAIGQRLDIMEKLEEGKISAIEAADMLEKVVEESWTKLSERGEQRQGRYLKIKVSDLASGVVRADLRLPVGLVNTVLYTGGRLSPTLEGLDITEIGKMIERSTKDGKPKVQDSGDERIEVELD
jgi:MFS family permease